jgi:hypothetical protein
VWHIGNGKSIRIGEDPWVNSVVGFKFSEELVVMLHDQNIFSLWEARAISFNLTGCSEWKVVEELEIECDMMTEWEVYAKSLSSNFIRM